MIEVLAASETRKERETRLWKEWKDSMYSPAKLSPLMKSLAPIIQDSINHHWRPTLRIPQEAVRAEAEDLTLKALKSYNPVFGAAVASWVQTNLRKLGRYVKTHQNVARIATKRLGWIGDYHRAREQLGENFGRPATHLEIADRISSTKRPISEADVRRMEQEDVKDVAFSQTAEDESLAAMPSFLRQQLLLLKHELTPDELYVLERLQGWHGGAPMRATHIARERGWSDAKVHRIKKAIVKKAKELL